MELSKESWHYKLFMKWRGLKFKDGYISYRYGSGLSLCCYVKVVFLFALPRMVFQSNITKLCVLNLFLSVVIYSELAYPWFLAFMILMSEFILFCGALGIVIVAIAATIMFFTESEASYKIIRPYLRAKKNKICPHIDFIDKEDI